MTRFCIVMCVLLCLEGCELKARDSMRPIHASTFSSPVADVDVVDGVIGVLTSNGEISVRALAKEGVDAPTWLRRISVIEHGIPKIIEVSRQGERALAVFQKSEKGNRVVIVSASAEAFESVLDIDDSPIVSCGLDEEGNGWCIQQNGNYRFQEDGIWRSEGLGDSAVIIAAAEDQKGLTVIDDQGVIYGIEGTEDVEIRKMALGTVQRASAYTARLRSNRVALWRKGLLSCYSSDTGKEEWAFPISVPVGARFDFTTRAPVFAYHQGRARHEKPDRHVSLLNLGDGQEWRLEFPGVESGLIGLEFSDNEKYFTLWDGYGALFVFDISGVTAPATPP